MNPFPSVLSRPRRRVLNALAAVLAASLLVACGGDDDATRNVDSIVSFGDSLSDLGTHEWGAVAAAGGGRYTTNPATLWVEHVASAYGLTIARNRSGGYGNPSPQSLGGYGYAEGGARITQAPGVGGTPSGTPGVPVEAGAMTVRDQIGTHLQTVGNRVPSTQLILVFAGANDVFFQLYAFSASVQQGVPAATAQQAAAGAMATAANELAAEVGRLVSAGATKVVVVTLPDIGQTPFGRVSGPQGSALASGLSRAFNDTLTAALSGRPAVTLVASQEFFGPAVANPARYGFTNTTTPACTTASSLVCTSRTLVAPNAEATYLFADDVHPTAAGHERFAQFVLERIGARIPSWL